MEASLRLLDDMQTRAPACAWEPKNAPPVLIITDLQAQVDDWKGQAEFWQHRDIELEEKLLSLSRSASMKSPSKHDPNQTNPRTSSVHSRFLKALPMGQDAAHGPREISRRFVRAIVRVKTEDDEDEDEEDSRVPRAVVDSNLSRGDIWERERDENDESSDELTLGELSPVSTSSPAKRMGSSKARASPNGTGTLPHEVHYPFLGGGAVPLTPS
ncbi:hypothetical protein B0H14DRAFT_3439132 [Mycena olivaceomarginata]|nr:hypothetical protein B0H14DRAFT_3439132 [Mycena olivaceomarginata]